MRGCAQLSGSDKFNEGAAPCRAALRCAAELRIHSEVRMFCVICCKVLRRRAVHADGLSWPSARRESYRAPSWCVSFLLQRLRVTHYDCLHSSPPVISTTSKRTGWPDWP